MGSNQSKPSSTGINLDTSNIPSNPSSVPSDSISTDKTTTTSLPLHHPVISSKDSGGGCPMKRNGGGYFGWGFSMKNDQHSTSSDYAGKDEKGIETDASREPSSCPVKKDNVQYNVYSQPIDPNNHMPAVANQLPHPYQKEKLSTQRVKSSIPKGGSDNDNWTYPSPQMFYNSLARKNKLGDTTEREIESVVALHNNMNEKTWQKVLQWESLLTSSSSSSSSFSSSSEEQTPPPPKLLKFMGRPSDLSPKAWFKSWMGHPLPFDRHDWTVLRNDGTQVRYVIDYYYDESKADSSDGSGLPAMDNMDAVKSILVDVRPAVDSLESVMGRFVRMPYARHVEKSTKFETLPFLPTSELRKQVGESQLVWQSIQQNVMESNDPKKNPTKKSSSSKSHNIVLQQSDLPEEQREDSVPVTVPETMSHPKVSNHQAQEIATNFVRMLSECEKHQKRLNQCNTDEECNKSTLALTMCLAKILCPVQQEAMEVALNADDFDPKDEKSLAIYNATFEKALENMSLCVTAKSQEAAAAKQQYPEKFSKS